MALSTPRTWVTGELVTAAMMNQDVRDNISFLANAPGCSVRHSTSQSVANATWQAIVFDTEDDDASGMHSTSSLTSRITIAAAGVYIFLASLEFVPNATGSRGIGFRLNGSGASPTHPYNMHVNNGAGLGTAAQSSLRRKMAAGDYLEVLGWQNSGGALNVGGPSFNMPSFSAQWVSLG